MKNNKALADQVAKLKERATLSSVPSSVTIAIPSSVPLVDAEIIPSSVSSSVPSTDSEGEREQFLDMFNSSGGTRFRCFNSSSIAANHDQLSDAIHMGDRGSNVFFLPNLGGQKKTDITSITALFIDVDAKDHLDKLGDNGNLPLPEFHLEPTAIVRSGSGGYHAYWILESPVLVTNTNESVFGLRYSNNHSQPNYGGDFTVHDLPRVMRLPGTINRKNNTPCELVTLNQNRYSVDEVMGAMPTPALPATINRGTTNNQTKVPNPDRTATHTPNPLYPNKVIKQFVIPYLNRIKLEPDSKSTKEQINKDQYTVTQINRHLAVLSQCSEGSRNSTLYKTPIHLLSICNSLSSGIESKVRSSLIEQLQLIGLDLGLSDDEVNTTLNSVINSELAKQTTYTPKEDRVTAIKWVILNLLYRGDTATIWRNELDERNYLNNEPITDDHITEITEAVSWVISSRNQTREQVETAVKELALDHRVNPFRAYLQSLGTPSGKAINTLINHYKLDEDGEVAFRYGLHQAVGGILGGTDQPLEVMPILCGGQSKGKTTLLRSLFSCTPLVKPVEGAFSDQDSKDTLLSVFHGSALIVDECADILRTRNVEAAKGLLSRRVFDLRAPYGQHSQRYIRSFTIWGTSNKNNFLSDETGNRRFLPIDFSNAPTIIEGTKTLDIDVLRDDLWSEVIQDWYSNPTNRPPHSVTKQVNIAAATYRSEPEGFEEVAMLLEDTSIDTILKAPDIK